MNRKQSSLSPAARRSRLAQVSAEVGIALALLATPHALADATAVASGPTNWSCKASTSIKGKNPCSQPATTLLGANISAHCYSSRALFPRGTATADASVTGGSTYQYTYTTQKGVAGGEDDPFAEDFVPVLGSSSCELRKSQSFGPGGCTLDLEFARDDGGRFEIAVLDTRGMTWPAIQALYENDTSIGVAIRNGHIPASRVLGYIRERDLPVHSGSLSIIVPTNGLGQSEVSVLSLVDARSTDCDADFDGDGFVTGDDFDGFVQAFEAGDETSDFDGDGFVTGDDFDAYVAAFENGC